VEEAEQLSSPIVPPPGKRRLRQMKMSDMFRPGPNDDAASNDGAHVGKRADDGEAAMAMTASEDDYAAESSAFVASHKSLVDNGSSLDAPKDVDNSGPSVGNKPSEPEGDDELEDPDDIVSGPDNSPGESFDTANLEALFATRDQDTLPCVNDVDDPDVQNFRECFRKILDALHSMVKSVTYNENLPRNERAMTFDFWRLIGQTSVDFLYRLFLGGIPLQVQKVFGKSNWEMRDLLSLPDWSSEDRVGIYGNIAKDAHGPPNAYVGSAMRSLKGRVQEHVRVSRRELNSLPHWLARSAHYRHICKDGVSSNFFVFAAFEPGTIAPGYLLLLEGIVVVILDVYQDRNPGVYHDWCNKASYEFVEELREASGFSDAPWLGLNGAWPCYQGFGNALAKRVTACKNPVCTFKCYPKGQQPVGESKRRVFEDGNPLDGYLCGYCGDYRYRNHHLPDAAFLKDRSARRVARRAQGKDAECFCCKRPELQFEQTRTGEPGTKRAGEKFQGIRRYQLRADYPGKLFCRRCHAYIVKNGKLLSGPKLDKIMEGDVKNKSGKSDLKAVQAAVAAAWAEGRNVYCYKCNAIEPKDKENTNWRCSKDGIRCSKCRYHEAKAKKSKKKAD
jgi:hypothetical protein